MMQREVRELALFCLGKILVLVKVLYVPIYGNNLDKELIKNTTLQLQACSTNLFRLL